MWIAGIDGGGTHTRVELRNEHNEPLKRLEFGPFNLNAIGEEAFRNLLRTVFAALGDMSRCSALCVGAAGISNPRVGEILRQELEAVSFRGKWMLVGDQEIALRGAMDVPGIALIAGTGSICFGKNAQGQAARSGGYGHLIDDGGSGYALGRDVLTQAVRTCDGRAHAQAILAGVYHRLGGGVPGDIVSFTYHPKTDKAAIAQFATLALELAEGGDEPALEILGSGAGELAAMVSAVQNSLGLEGCPIALLGGLIAGDNVYRKQVVQALKPLGKPIAPAHDALWGAAQLAWQLATE